MPQSVLVAIFTFIVLLVMAGTFLFFYFRSLRHELAEKWELVLDNLHLRLDKIPNLVESVRALAPGQEQLVDSLVQLRSASWPIVDAGKNKVHKELEISEKLNQVWELHKLFPGLEKDTNYLGLKSEFKEVSREIEKTLEGYNAQVRSYNKSAGNFLVAPFARIFRIQRLPVFEFEG